MKTEINKLKVKFQGRELTIDLQKELSINENIINSQLKGSPSSYYVLCSLKDKYIQKRDKLEREKDVKYSELWLFFKNSNERWNNEYVTHKVNSNKAYNQVLNRWFKAKEKADQFIALCRAYENREAILRSLNANLRKG